MPAPAHTANSQFAIRNSQLPDWFTPRRFAVFLLLAFVVAFPGIWMGTETFFRSDYGVMAYPAAHYLRESIWRGELPLWNPLSNCGAPFLAQWGTMCLYPGSLFFVVLPMPWALGVFCLLHLWLGGLGARALAERWTGNRFAAAVAGTAFALNGASLACITWPNYCVALGWLPWIVLLTEQAWREGGKQLVLAALAGTMQMLTGVPELVVLTWGLLGVLLLGELLELRQKAKGKRQKEDQTSPATFSFFLFPFSFAAIPVARFLAIIVLVAALSAAQLLPFFELLAHSQRDAAYRDARWPMPPWGWANFLVPLFRYGQTPQGFWIQVGQEFLSSYYLGLAPLALALLAVWKCRERRVWLIAGATAFALVMALGDAGYLYTALKNLLPGGGIARFPVKFVLLAAFTVPLLAAFGVAALQSRSGVPPDCSNSSTVVSTPALLNDKEKSDDRQDACPAWQALLRIAFALAALTSLTLWLGQQHPLQYDRWPETRANALARLAWLAAALSAVAVAAGAWARPARERLLAASALLVLLAADPLTHQPNQTPRVPAAVVQTGSPFRNEIRYVPDSGRIMISPAAEQKLLYGQHLDYGTLPPAVASDPASLWVLDYGGKLRTLWSHLNLLDGLPKVNGSSTLQIRAQAEVQKLLYPTNAALAPPAEGLKWFLGVNPQQLVDEKGQVAVRIAYSLPPNSSSLRIGAKPVFLPPDAILNELFSTNFNPNMVVLIASPTLAGDEALVAPAKGEVRTSRFSANEIVVETSAANWAALTVAQSFYHPWCAFVDGQPVKLWRANYAFQALVVPAGKHTVRLVYVDEKFRLGVGISLAGLAVCGWLWWRAGRKLVGDDVRSLASSPDKV